MFSFESSNAESLEELKITDVMSTISNSNGKLDIEDPEQIQFLQKAILLSAGFFKKVFPSWSEPLSAENRYV